jgi:hypothetical protein
MCRNHVRRFEQRRKRRIQRRDKPKQERADALE